MTATVIGVTPREFSGLQPGWSSRVWLPSAMEPLIRRPSRRMDGRLPLQLAGRLAPGVTIEQARAEMRLLDRERVEELATRSRNPRWRLAQIDVQPARAGFSALRDAVSPPLLALMAVTSLLLLIACTNVASMLLARAMARRREMAVTLLSAPAGFAFSSNCSPSRSCCRSSAERSACWSASSRRSRWRGRGRSIRGRRVWKSRYTWTCTCCCSAPALSSPRACCSG